MGAESFDLKAMQNENRFNIERLEDSLEAEGQGMKVIADPDCRMFHRVAKRIGLSDLVVQRTDRVLVVEKNGIYVYIGNGSVVITEKDLNL